MVAHEMFRSSSQKVSDSLNFKSILLETSLIVCKKKPKESTLTDISHYDRLRKSIILRNHSDTQFSYPRSLESFKYLNTMKGSPFIILKDIDFYYIFLSEVYLLLKQEYRTHSDDIINSYKVILQKISADLVKPLNSYEIFKSPLNKIERLFDTKRIMSKFIRRGTFQI